jgi:hypothetical protein
MEHYARKSRETLRELDHLVRREIPVCQNRWISIYLIHPIFLSDEEITNSLQPRVLLLYRGNTA